MRNKKMKLSAALAVMGAILVAIGQFVLTGDTIPGLFIAIGAGLFGFMMAQIIFIVIDEKYKI